MYAKTGRGSKSTTTLYMKREKSPLEPDTTHTGIRDKRHHIRSDHNRVWRWSVQVSVTEIVDVLRAVSFMPTNKRVQMSKGTELRDGTTHFSWI